MNILHLSDGLWLNTFLQLRLDSWHLGYSLWVLSTDCIASSVEVMRVLGGPSQRADLTVQVRRVLGPNLLSPGSMNPWLKSRAPAASAFLCCQQVRPGPLWSGLLERWCYLAEYLALWWDKYRKKVFGVDNPSWDYFRGQARLDLWKLQLLTRGSLEEIY